MPRASIAPLARRAFLRGAGVSLALPFLEAMRPVFGSAARAAEAGDSVPRRMVCIQTNQGIMPQFFFPEKAGRGFKLPPYLELLGSHRDQITVFSGVSLPGVTGGHQAEKCFITGTPHPDQNGFRNDISLDQVAAEHLGNRTRHPSLVLAMTTEGKTLSYTRNGSPIPAESSPRLLFQRLFVQGKPEEVAAPQGERAPRAGQPVARRTLRRQSSLERPALVRSFTEARDDQRDQRIDVERHHASMTHLPSFYGSQGDDAVAVRLMEMGLTEGAEIQLVGFAPLGDPIEFLIRGYRLSLRKAEAARVAIEVL